MTRCSDENHGLSPFDLRASNVKLRPSLNRSEIHRGYAQIWNRPKSLSTNGLWTKLTKTNFCARRIDITDLTPVGATENGQCTVYSAHSAFAECEDGSC